MADNPISVSELLGILQTEGLSEDNFDLVTSHIILPEFHDAVWVAIDNGTLMVEKVTKISDFVINHPSHATDIKVPCLLFFLISWKEYRKENYQKAHDGARRAIDIAPKYGPAKKLLGFIHDRVDQSRIPPLSLNEKGRLNPIEPTEPEELEINHRWL